MVYLKQILLETVNLSKNMSSYSLGSQTTIEKTSNN